uniref:Ubiquitin receptor RAD23 n=1 Tax=Brassica oleracea var. oleracea TaxID=109376 RepID=A0A0D3EF52_BRAOL
MKIFVKTLKGAPSRSRSNPMIRYVADVKKNIEKVLGVTAAEQMLIHKGKVLKDETTLEANNVSEKSIIGVIKRKPASTGTSSLKPQELPVQFEDHFITEVNTLNFIEARGVCVNLKTEDNQDEKGETHQERPSVADLERALDFARYNPEVLSLFPYEYLRALAQSDPSIVKDFLETLEEDSPTFFQWIRENKAGFLRLQLEGGTCGNEMQQQPHEHQEVQTNEPNNGGDGGNLVGESKETDVEVATPEDYELIARLEALGFERGDAEVAYFACNKNVQEAANHLLGHKHESQE